jgi:hypothetical protein
MATTTCSPLQLQWLRPRPESRSNGLLTFWLKTCAVQKANLVGQLCLKDGRYLV